MAGNHGFCQCCRQPTFFQVRGAWLRDQYVCIQCGSIPRQRHLMYILDRYFPGWEQWTIHESSPSVNFLARWCPEYSCSQLFPNVALGGFVNGVRCENLERLTFASESFDLFVTQDVFEHVFDPARGLTEIMRVLRPGGAHVFTAPKHRGLRTSSPRAQLFGGEVTHIREPEYHGNPVGDRRSLVTWDYGDDFELLMTRWTGYPVCTFVNRDAALGIDGEYLEVFVMRKTEEP
jgi:SAM-dependent methyltransferase